MATEGESGGRGGERAPRAGPAELLAGEVIADVAPEPVVTGGGRSNTSILSESTSSLPSASSPARSPSPASIAAAGGAACGGYPSRGGCGYGDGWAYGSSGSSPPCSR